MPKKPIQYPVHAATPINPVEKVNESSVEGELQEGVAVEYDTPVETLIDAVQTVPVQEIEMKPEDVRKIEAMPYYRHGVRVDADPTNDYQDGYNAGRRWAVKQFRTLWLGGVALGFIIEFLLERIVGQ